MVTPITQAEKDQWVADLRSGKFKQITGALVSSNPLDGECRCVLGVLLCQSPYATLEGNVGFGSWTTMADHWLYSKLPISGLRKWLDRNDVLRQSFTQIANEIEATPLHSL